MEEAGSAQDRELDEQLASDLDVDEGADDVVGGRMPIVRTSDPCEGGQLA